MPPEEANMDDNRNGMQRYDSQRYELPVNEYELGPGREISFRD